MAKKKTATRKKTVKRSTHSKKRASPKKSARLTSSLKTYRKKRNFAKTSEPYSTPRTSVLRNANQPIFVVQKHAASHLHYDFRLEFRGVLKSWAVPKGIPTKLGVKHLAAPTEDHPLEWAKFQGTIPAGEYGAGTVETWDHGTYQNIKEIDGKKIPMSKCLEMGRVEVWLEGNKLHGGYALVRAGHPDTEHGEKEYWLILKMRAAKSKKRLKDWTDGD